MRKPQVKTTVIAWWLAGLMVGNILVALHVTLALIYPLDVVAWAPLVAWLGYLGYRKMQTAFVDGWHGG